MSSSIKWQDIGIVLTLTLSRITTTPKVVDKVFLKTLMDRVGVLKYDRGILRCWNDDIDTTLII